MTRRDVAINTALLAASLAICLLIAEAVLWALGLPEPLISGWQSAKEGPPRNQLGWRGQKIDIAPDDFVVVLVGDSHVACRICPPDETTDVILQRALRQYNPKARVVNVGTGGIGTDQELLALEEYFKQYRANLVLLWLTMGNDIWNNTFRTTSLNGKRARLKPTFWIQNGELRGPTELPGTRVDPDYSLRLVAFIERLLHDPEAEWAVHLPPADPGTASPPDGATRSYQTVETVETQQSHWAIWLNPRPARVDYGIELTRVLLSRMRDVAKSHGAGFAMFQHDHHSPASIANFIRMKHPRYSPGTVALTHGGHWYLADPEMYRKAREDTVRGFPFMHVPITLENARVSDRDLHLNLEGNRQVLGDLAAMMAKDRLLQKK